MNLRGTGLRVRTETRPPYPERGIISPMKLKTGGLWSTAWLVILTAGLCAQAGTPGQPAPPPQADQTRPTFTVQVDLVTTDVIPRDDKGNFIADLTKGDFEIYEDGVK